MHLDASLSLRFSYRPVDTEEVTVHFGYKTTALDQIRLSAFQRA